MNQKQLEVLKRIAARDKRYKRYLTDEEQTSPSTSEPIEFALIRCMGCKGNVKIKVHKGMPISAMVRLLNTTLPDDNWPKGWQDWDVTKQAINHIEKRK